MRRILVGCAGMALAMVSSSALAGSRFTLAPMKGTHWTGSGQHDRAVVPGSPYTVYTGLADNSNYFYLPEAYPAVRDDVVSFNGVEEQINDYVNVGFGLLGQRRFVTESTVTNGDGSKTDAVTIRAVDFNGAPADLWPAGVYFNGSIPLPHAGIGLGLDMPPDLGGNQPMNLAPGSVVSRVTVEVISDGSSSGQLDLPLEQFLFPSPANWDGSLGLVIFSAADTFTVDSQVTIRITSAAPEPGIIGMLAVVPVIGRRRR